MDPELVTYLDRRFTAIDDRFTEIDRHFAESDDRFTAIDDRFNAIDDRFNAIDDRFNAIDDRFTAIDDFFTEGERRQSQGLHRALAAQSVELRAEMALQSEVDRRFLETHVLIEGLEAKIETVAEGVAANYENHQRALERIDGRFDELKAIFRLSYGEGARGAAEPG